MATAKSLQEYLISLDEAIRLQSTDGTWNYDPYLHGMANGLIYAKSLLTGEDPKYLDPPAFYKVDLKILDKLSKGAKIKK